MKQPLLVIAHRLPYPPDKGDKIRTYNFVSFLEKYYQVTVACIIDDPDDIKHVDELEEKVTRVFYQVKPSSKKNMWAVRSLFTGRSVSQESFYSSKLQRQIDEYVEESDPVAILCFCTSTSDYLFRSGHSLPFLQKRILLNDLIDVDSEKWYQYAPKHSGFMGWVYRREGRLLREAEKQVVDAFDKVFLVTDDEKKVLSQHSSVENVEALPNGVDFEYFKLNTDIQSVNKEETCKLVFSGAMDYWPNIEGAVWFAKYVFPQIRQSVPEVKFCIAGRNPTDEVQALEKIEGVQVTGTIPDMRKYLSSATICVVPLMIARGIQNKVLEAMAMGKPVVATTGAVTGTKTVDGLDIVIADEALKMAESIISLLSDADKRKELGSNARTYVEREHSWDSHLEKLNDIIKCGKI